MSRVVVCAVLVSCFAHAQEAGDDVGLDVPSRLTEPPLSKVTSLAKERDLLAQAVPSGGRLAAPVDGALEPLTIDPTLQAELEAILEKYETPYAAVVAVEPSSGRVLAMAEHSAAEPELRGLATRALYPAASIFKIVTAAALLDVGVDPAEVLCAHGGKRKVKEAQLEDSDRDTRCLSFSQALAMSANVVFAKFTSRYLDAEKLKAAARAFHFNAPFRFPVPTDVSLAAVPSETYPLALTGAGFGDVYLSPLHGAALAAVAANKGLWRSPVLLERDVPAAPPTERVVSEQVAERLTAMLEETVTQGTARRIFHERGMRVPGAVGKTGSLADKHPYRDYTWFVGFAPKEAPRIAVAAVIVNEAKWRIRATWLGREAMRLFLSRR
ncbi:MAG: penicillin-binding transpeptidase domain-containing protein [Myxococcaceae bacterium]|nr:penicillin-binding transpeptidase domain-containing protein [Myxococcaceae bacterium]